MRICVRLYSQEIDLVLTNDHEAAGVRCAESDQRDSKGIGPENVPIYFFELQNLLEGTPSVDY